MTGDIMSTGGIIGIGILAAIVIMLYFANSVVEEMLKKEECKHCKR